MKKLLLFFFLILTASFFVALPMAKSDELDDINKQITDLTTALNQSKAATAPLEAQLNSIKGRVAFIEGDLANKKIQIDKGYKDLEKQTKSLNQAIRNYYIKSYYNSPIIVFLSSAKSASQITQVLAYQKVAADQDKQIITNIALTIQDLQTKQKNLEAEQAKLAIAKANLDKIVTGAKSYQANLSGQIAALSAKQSELLAQKYNSLGIPTTAYTSNKGCSSDIDPYKDPGFSGTKFGFFTYGVYHRVGMNQYGAKGRADSGKSYQDILSFYYPNTQLNNVGTGFNITVNGTNDYSQTFSSQSFNVEDYLKHIYEMPSSWSSEALKAQAVAARSYAVQAVQNGRTTVPPNQSFQEIKTEENAQSWIDAVNATSGQVLQAGGQTITAWFSSTAGGYTHNSGDVFGNSTSYTTTTADANGGIGSFSDLQNNAYDGPHYANSPWFYCDWGGRSSYNNTAWLKSDEVADIVNVIMLSQNDPSTNPHLSPPDSNIPDTWDAGRVRQELSNRHITPFNSINNVSVNADFGSGRTTSIAFNGDAGTKSWSGDTFTYYFDLRAPSNIFIPCLKWNGNACAAAPLFNVEQR